MTQATPPIVFKWSARQVMLATLFVVSVGAIFWLLFRFRGVIFILFVAIVIGWATKPAVKWMSGRGIPPLVGQIILYFVVFLAVAGFLLLAVPLILEQGTSLVAQLSQYYHALRNLMVESPSYLLKSLGYRLPVELQAQAIVEGAQPAQAGAQTAPGETVTQALTLAGTVIRSLLALVAVLLMAFYWTLEGERAVRSFVLIAPKDRREGLREILEEIEGRVGGYIFGLVILSLIVGTMALAAYLIIGLRNALVLAMIAGVMEAVPVVGPTIGAVVAMLVAASTDPSKVIWVLVASGLIQFAENYFLVPRVMGRSVGVHPLLTLLALAGFSTLLGVPGALMAIPLAAVIQLVLGRFVLRTGEPEAIEPEGRDYISYLRYQAQEIAMDIRKQLREKEEVTDGENDEIENSLETIAADLDRVLAQAGQAEANAQ